MPRLEMLKNASKHF